MSESFQGASALITIVVVGAELGNLTGVDLAADGPTNLAVDAQDDLAVTTDVTWLGSAASQAITVLGQAVSALSAGAA